MFRIIFSINYLVNIQSVKTQPRTKSYSYKENKIYLATISEDQMKNRDFLYVYNFLTTIFILNMALDRSNIAFTESIYKQHLIWDQ